MPFHTPEFILHLVCQSAKLKTKANKPEKLFPPHCICFYLAKTPTKRKKNPPKAEGMFSNVISNLYSSGFMAKPTTRAKCYGKCYRWLDSWKGPVTFSSMLFTGRACHNLALWTSPIHLKPQLWHMRTLSCNPSGHKLGICQHVLRLSIRNHVVTSFFLFCYMLGKDYKTYLRLTCVSCNIHLKNSLVIEETGIIIGCQLT